MTINDYADALSDALNANLRPGEPAWSVVRHPRLTDRLLVEQWSDPPRLLSIRWTADSPDPVDVSCECATMVGPLTWSDPERPAVCHVFWRGTEAHGGDVGAWKPRIMLPNLQDPATLGCLLALVREAWGDPGLHVSIAHGGYCFVRHAGGADLRWAPPQCDSEPAALAYALLAAPPHEPR